MTKKRIVLTGAGSGGHITPLLAVADEIKRLNPETELVYIGQKGDALGDIPSHSKSIDAVYAVRAGKFRRYHGEGLKQILDIPTLLKNCRDAVYVLIGLFQSWRLLRRLRPDALFVKGGFVGVPVGIAASWLKIPYVTHDSDAIPGLANRIIAKKASLHAVAMPKDMYRYPADKTVMTGIPLQKGFETVSADLKARYKQEICVPSSAKVLFVIGGGLGSQRINGVLVESVPHLLEHFNDLYVIHVVGLANKESISVEYTQTLSESQSQRLQVYGYLDDVYKYSGAADLIITRAGATNLAEFAVQGKACIVVPSPFLAGGHQLKNAELLEANGAIAVLPEDQLLSDSNKLVKLATHLLEDDQKRIALSKHFNEIAIADGAERLAKLLLEITDKRGGE